MSEDPIQFLGGNDFYPYALNRPTVLVDFLGLDGHTWGPFSWFDDPPGMNVTEIAAERAHEYQHRCDFWNGNAFYKSCEFLESRGWAADVPIFQQRLNELRQQNTLTASEKSEMQQLTEDLEQAQGLADPNGMMIRVYCKHPISPSPAPAPFPPCHGWQCIDNR